MSKEKSHESVTVLLPLWTMGVLWSKNFSRLNSPFDPTSPKTRELIESIATHGIQDDRPVVVVKATKDEVAEMVADRQTILANLLAIYQDKPTKENEHALKVRQYLWLDDKQNIRKPTYRVVSGNTRVSCTPFALTKRAIEDGTFAYESVIGETKWAAKVYETLSREELVKMQALENELNKTGTADPSQRDKYLNVLEMVSLGASEADCRKIYKDGTGRRLYYAAIITNRFPSLKLKERILSDDPTFCFNLSKLHHSDDRPVITRTNKELLDKENAKLQAAGGQLLTAMTEADVFEWMEMKMGRKTVDAPVAETTKALDKKKVALVADNSPNAVVKASMEAVRTGNMEHIERIMPLTVGVNALTKIGPHTILFALLGHIAALSPEDRESAIADCSQAVGKYKLPVAEVVEATVE